MNLRYAILGALLIAPAFAQTAPPAQPPTPSFAVIVIDQAKYNALTEEIQNQPFKIAAPQLTLLQVLEQRAQIEAATKPAERPKK